MAIFRYFFDYADRLPGDVGFQLFGPSHIVWLVVIACAAVFISRHYKSLRPDQRRTFELFVAWTILSLDVLRYIFYIVIGVFSVGLLPLHLCGMAVYITLFNALRPSKFKQELLYSLCMPGAATALLFPNWTVYPILSLVSLQSFIIHGLLVIYPLMLFTSGQIKPDYRNLPRCFLFLVIISPPLYLFNRAFGTNFFFLNYPSPGSPLVLFAQWLGNPGYLLGAIILILMVWAGLYLPLILIRRRQIQSQSN